MKTRIPDFSAAIPFAQGAEEILAWYDADPARHVVDEDLNNMMDSILAAYEKAWPR